MRRPTLRLPTDPRPAGPCRRTGPALRGRRRRLQQCLAAALVLTAWQPTTFALDRGVLAVGAGHEGSLIRLGAQWELDRRWFEDGRWHLGLLIEAEIGGWQPELGDRGLYEIAVTPVIRVLPNRPPSPRPAVFIEAGIGPHLLSNVRFSGLDLSTSLQFGSHIGAGVLFGRGGRYSLTYRFQHLSNASIKQPNPGIEFHLLQLGYRISAAH
ncbi:MAG TPA: acyloxyacyl hydrolase [Candidatus Sulfomarinibacteraceae bacterium]|nr:acyloxyacyl hydrolase [Candidatus Sulfomarinibacteraceae bacterium]